MHIDTYSIIAAINLFFKMPPHDSLGVFFFSALSLGAGSLGIWQYQRYHWKIGVIEEAKARFNESPFFVPPNLSQNELAQLVNAKRGERVVVEGKYFHEKEVLLGPRSGQE